MSSHDSPQSSAIDCPENSLCSPYGPGFFECSCIGNYHGYKCLREVSSGNSFNCNNTLSCFFFNVLLQSSFIMIITHHALSLSLCSRFNGIFPSCITLELSVNAGCSVFPHKTSAKFTYFLSSEQT